MKKSELVSLIKEVIIESADDRYTIGYFKGKYNYVSFGPSYYTWEGWKTADYSNAKDFGQFNSPQAAKKEFLRRNPVEPNYYKWGESAHVLLRNGKPILLVGNASKLI